MGQIPLESSSIQVHEVALKSFEEKKIKIEALHCTFRTIYSSPEIYRKETIPASGLRGEIYQSAMLRNTPYKFLSDERYFSPKLRGIAAIFRWIAKKVINKNKARSGPTLW